VAKGLESLGIKETTKESEADLKQLELIEKRKALVKSMKSALNE
jgi:hypothetical protein